MKTTFTTIIFLLIGLNLIGQNKDSIIYSIEDNTVYDLVVVHEQPQFPGGDDSLSAFFEKNIQYSQIEKEKNIQGKVFVSFIVNKNGSVTDVELYKGLKGCLGCDKEAIRVAKMMPKWSPGKNNGKPVRTRYIMPVHPYLFDSNKALIELKKWKEKLDLGLITQEEYNKKKVELSKYIK